MDNNLFIMMMIIIIFFILICGINIYKHLNKDNFDTSIEEEEDNGIPNSINSLVIEVAINEDTDTDIESGSSGGSFLDKINNGLKSIVKMEDKLINSLKNL